MGVIRSHTTDSSGKPGTGSVTVQCPKCQANIQISDISGHKPVRCGKCHYPMILEKDLRIIVAACRKAEGPGKADSAARILRKMMEYLPEAGTALGELAGKNAVISEAERWNCLTTAYAGGDENARAGLNLMCDTGSDKYQQILCRHCGAPRYVLKKSQAQSPCIYCHYTD